MWKPGRRLHTTAAILMLLTALAHTLGSLSAEPSNDAERKLMAAMQGYRIPLGMGMNPSQWDIFRGLSLTMSITLAALAAVNLAIAADADASGRLLRKIGWINAVWVGAFTALYAVLEVPPPLISGLLIEAAVLGSLFGRR